MSYMKEKREKNYSIPSLKNLSACPSDESRTENVKFHFFFKISPRLSFNQLVGEYTNHYFSFFNAKHALEILYCNHCCIQS